MALDAENAGALAEASDEDLVALMAHANRDALSHLYERYASVLLTWLTRWLRDSVAAEDLVHDLFLQIWRDSGKYDAELGSVKNWLFMLLRRRAIDYCRGSTTHARIERSIAVGLVCAETMQLAHLEFDLIMRHLSALRPKHREVITAIYLNHESVVAVAERLGVPPNTVKSRLARAIQALRDSIVQVTSSSL